MKKIKMFAATLAAVMALALLPDAHSATAEAAEPVTYSVKYLENEGWRYATGSTFEGYHTDVYYLPSTLKDGDKVVVYNDLGSDTALDLGSVHLSNLTISVGCQWSIIKVGSVDVVDASRGSSSSITGNVTYANVYFDAFCNFNSDIKLLTLYHDNDGVEPTVGCGGKVDQLTSRSYSNSDWVYSNYYNFQINSLSITSGYLNTPEEKYSLVPVGSEGTTSATSAASTPASGDSEYDDVPKTGQSNVYLWLLGAAAVCFAGSGLAKRASR